MSVYMIKVAMKRVARSDICLYSTLYYERHAQISLGIQQICLFYSMSLSSNEQMIIVTIDYGTVFYMHS